MGVTCSIFGPILGTFLENIYLLRNLKDSPDIFHECLDITVVVTKLKVKLTFLQHLTFFPINSYFHFSKFRIIAVVSTEVEQDVMSTLVYVYAYLYAS